MNSGDQFQVKTAPTFGIENVRSQKGKGPREKGKRQGVRLFSTALLGGWELLGGRHRRTRDRGQFRTNSGAVEPAILTRRIREGV